MNRVPACLVVLIVLWTTVAIAQQPAGDAAQKTKPKRASRVITDDDLPQHLSAEPSPTSPAETQKSPGGSEKSAGSDAKADGTGAMSDKKGGESALEALQSRLQELEFDETNLTNGNKNLEEEIAKEEASGRREVLQNALTNRKRSLERTKSERSDITRQIEALKKKASSSKL